MIYINGAVANSFPWGRYQIYFVLTALNLTNMIDLLILGPSGTQPSIFSLTAMLLRGFSK